MFIFAFILFLFIAAACAYLAEKFVPATERGEFVIPVVAGVIGAGLGSFLVGHFGPDLAGVSLIPSILCSTGLVLLVCLIF
jgi:uncharacterized membrane protein YeaQ/YmgE (transglycosylase-associated protein family)